MTHSPCLAANYTWSLYPIAGQALYGYEEATNKSFRSENIQDGVKNQVEDGINALFVPAGVEIDLGDFAGTCVSNPTLCDNFTVSFLLKTSADKDLKVLDSGVKDGDKDEYGWSFEIDNYGDAYAMVADGDIVGHKETLIATDAWILMAFTFHQGRFNPHIVLYQNGSHGIPPSMGSSSFQQDKNTRLKLGSASNTKGFFISNLKFIGMKLNDKQIQEHGNGSFNEGMMWFERFIYIDLYVNQDLSSFSCL